MILLDAKASAKSFSYDAGRIDIYERYRLVSEVNGQWVNVLAAVKKTAREFMR